MHALNTETWIWTKVAPLGAPPIQRYGLTGWLSTPAPTRRAVGGGGSAAALYTAGEVEGGNDGGSVLQVTGG